MKRTYEILIRVPADSLTVVLEVVKDCADLVSVKQIDEFNGSVETKRSRQVHRSSIFNCRDLIKETITNASGQPVSIQALRKVLNAKGFSKNSAGPAVNELVREGKVKKIAPALYSSV